MNQRAEPRHGERGWHPPRSPARRDEASRVAHMTLVAIGGQVLEKSETETVLKGGHGEAGATAATVQSSASESRGGQRDVRPC